MREMKLFSRPFGAYQTNAYVLKFGDEEIIIDPGDGAREWVLGVVKNPKAILCTHGHFDHIFDVGVLKKELNVPVWIHKDDTFMLENDVDFAGYECCSPDFAVDEGVFECGEFKFEFMHFPGHTPGCSMIAVDDMLFSGDFLFAGAIGRYDFKYSNPSDMLKSLEKVSQIKREFKLYPGHGNSTTLQTELLNLPRYMRYLKSDML
ncbi:MBL fold metallo-hydrolase [Campylobacter mucosalis]|uniref:MBL fold metallo-hydrolase n=1 Tax=Campylobacter mucosalis TaxID=202 RepID=UPI003211B372